MSTAPAVAGPDDLDDLHTRVLDWYADHARDLPWRAADRTPWGVLVSEVMLQQTPVARVLPQWLAWMERWPTPSDLADAAPGDAVRAWDRLGYPRRALRLHAAAVALRDEHGGEVPDDHAQLLALPGIGSYTAAAVASFAFGQRYAVVDTNVRRVHARAVTGAAEPATALTAAEQRLAVALLPTTRPRPPAGPSPSWSSAPSCAPPAPPAATTARCWTAAPGCSPAARPTTAPPAEARPGPGPTARCAASCCPSCAAARTP